MNKFLLLIFLFTFQVGLFAEKVLIITSAYNRPDFIEIQYKTFKKFLLDEYEFIVFNDATDRKKQKAIQAICRSLGIKCIDVPQMIHDLPYLERFPGEWYHAPAVRNANVVQYALQHSGYKHDGIVAIIDSDMFLVKPFSIKEYLNGYDLAGVPQSRSSPQAKIDYLWIGIAFLDMKTLPEKKLINFNCGKIHGVLVDAGGYTYHYLHKYPHLKIREFLSLHTPNLSCSPCIQIKSRYPCPHNRDDFRRYGLDDQLIDDLHAGLDNVEFFIDGTFFHYRSGTNWDRKKADYHNKKTALFNKYMDRLLN